MCGTVRYNNRNQSIVAAVICDIWQTNCNMIYSIGQWCMLRLYMFMQTTCQRKQRLFFPMRRLI